MTRAQRRAERAAATAHLDDLTATQLAERLLLCAQELVEITDRRRALSREAEEILRGLGGAPHGS